MIYVYSVIYYHNKDHEIREHKFEKFKDAVNVVAETWPFEPGNVYTIVDDREV